MIRLFVSAVFAATLAVLVYVAIPGELNVHTDIVGYPTFANFNVDRYFWAYGLTVAFFPLATLAGYLVLTRLLVGPRRTSAPIPAPVERIEAVLPVPGSWAPLVAAARTLFLGAVLTLELAIIAGGSFGWKFVAIMLGFATATAGGALIASRVTRREPVDIVSTLNIVTSPLTVLGLYGVSESTEVSVSATGAVHSYPWLPLWLALGVSSALLLWLGVRLARSRSASERSALERRALLLVVAPVGLFLFVAVLPGALGSVDFFEEGQVLAGSEQVWDGAFPWRDLLVAHGLLHDAGAGLLGSSVFEESRWGIVAGGEILLIPLSSVAFYYLCVYLFGTNWLFLAGTQLLVITGEIAPVHVRFLLVPVVLLLLAGLLQRGTATRAIALASLLALQLIVTPEALPAVVACVGVVVFFEAYYYERGQGLATGFRRTWLFFAAGAVVAAGWSVFLAANGALDDFIFSYRTFLPGHRLTGGIPRQTFPGDEFEIVAPIILVLGAFAFFVVRTRLRRELALTDWVMLATAGLTLLYYTKFLSRADHFHLFHAFSVVVPLLFYTAYRGVTFGEAWLAGFARERGAGWFPLRHTISLPLLVVLLASAPIGLVDAVRGVPSRFSEVAPREPELERIGFDSKGSNATGEMRDVSRAVDSLLEPGDTVFDFSNAPGLFHYLLDLPPSTRYYHVSMAIRKRTQTDLVRLLREARPGAVVFTSDGGGEAEPQWDGIPNQIRHYEVSEYLLDNYVPVTDSHGFVLMAPRDRGAREVSDLYFRNFPCDWGYVPNFFEPAPALSSERLDLSFRRLAPVIRIRGWAEDRQEGTPAAEVVATLHGRVIARVRPRQRRPSLAYAFDDWDNATSGFWITLPAPDAAVAHRELDEIRVYALTRSGDATELLAEASPRRQLDPGGRLNLGGGRSTRLVADASMGEIEAAGVEEPLAVTLPAGATTYRWLEVGSGEPLRAGRFELVDGPSAPNGSRVISFNTLDRGGTSVRVRVGACSQWRGYRPGILYLTSSMDRDIRRIRLLR